MNMAKKMFDDDIKKIEFFNTELLIQNKKPVKIYLEGFPIEEFVELVNIVKDYGGEISSRVDTGVIVLSRPNCLFETDSPKFHVKWLYDCINFSKILNPSKYQLELPNTNIKHEVEVENHHPIGPMNVRLQRGKNSADCHSQREATRSRFSSLPKKHALPHIINENLDILKNPSELQRTPKRSCIKPPDNTVCDSSEENKSSKSKRSVCTTSPLLSSPIVSSSKVESSTSDIKFEVEEEDDRHVRQINVGLQQEENATDDNNMRGNMIRMSEVSSFPQTNASIDINENAVPEDRPGIWGTPKYRECSQQSASTSCNSSNKKKSSRKEHYTEREGRAMIQYLIDNDAIDIAGGREIWKRMHEDQMMQHHTLEAMRQHYTVNLQKRFRDFTSDEEALRKFEARIAKRRGRKRKSL